MILWGSYKHFGNTLRTGVKCRISGHLNMTPMGEKRVHRHYSWFFHANLPQTDQWNLILYSLLGGLFRQKATRSRIAPIIAMGSGPVDSDPHLNSSTQAELFGLASALQFLQEFIKFHNIDTESKKTIWSDSTAAIARLDYLAIMDASPGESTSKCRHSVFHHSPP